MSSACTKVHPTLHGLQVCLWWLHPPPELSEQTRETSTCTAKYICCVGDCLPHLYHPLCPLLAPHAALEPDQRLLSCKVNIYCTAQAHSSTTQPASLGYLTTATFCNTNINCTYQALADKPILPVATNGGNCLSTIVELCRDTVSQSTSPVGQAPFPLTNPVWPVFDWVQACLSGVFDIHVYMSTNRHEISYVHHLHLNLISLKLTGNLKSACLAMHCPKRFLNIPLVAIKRVWLVTENNSVARPLGHSRPLRHAGLATLAPCYTF